MKIEIKITKEVLKRSMWCGVADHTGVVKPASANCAIAVAVRDIFPKAIVGGSEMWFMLPGTSRESVGDTNIPDVASKFIIKFDSLRSKPLGRISLPEFSFEIEVPDEVIERIGINEAKAILENSETLSLVD